MPEENLDRPLVGIISRFVDQKGFDLVVEIAEELARENMSLIALGTGQAVYEKALKAFADKHPGKVAVKIGFDNALAHKIEAGSDMFLMPSRFEPCGLNQIYSLRYGTVPVVRATGGLDDTVQNYEESNNQGTGFKFEEYSGEQLLDAVRRALKVFRDPKAWQVLQANGMLKDFSWKTSAAAYVTLYEAAKRSRIPRVSGTSNRR
jgi:starch synthase